MGPGSRPGFVDPAEESKLNPGEAARLTAARAKIQSSPGVWTGRNAVDDIAAVSFYDKDLGARLASIDAKEAKPEGYLMAKEAENIPGAHGETVKKASNEVERQLKKMRFEQGAGNVVMTGVGFATGLAIWIGVQMVASPLLALPLSFAAVFGIPLSLSLSSIETPELPQPQKLSGRLLQGLGKVVLAPFRAVKWLATGLGR
jgi:hypothetical protein